MSNDPIETAKSMADATTAVATAANSGIGLVDKALNWILELLGEDAKGYWKDKQETNKVLVKHEDKIWYKTGDSGTLKDGFLFFNGRISENYKMNNGKFVNVASVEANLKKYISTNFIIYGEDMNYNVLIVEDEFEDKILEIVNTELESYMKIKKVIKINTEEMAEFLTPKMSIKRKKLIEFVKNNNTL